MEREPEPQPVDDGPAIEREELTLPDGRRLLLYSDLDEEESD
jgi:hypothetical protein